MATMGILRQGKLFRVASDRMRRNALSNIFSGLTAEEIQNLYHVQTVRADSSMAEAPAEQLEALTLGGSCKPKKKLQHTNSVDLLRATAMTVE